MLSVFFTLMASAVAGTPDAFTFVVVGDVQTDGDESSINWDVLPQLITDMNTHDPVYGLFVGDLVGGTYSVSGTVNQWQDFITATSDFVGTPLPIPGNHDVYGGAGSFAAFADTFDWLPQDDSPVGEEGVSYYIDHENVRFIGVTSDQETGLSYRVSATALSWLDGVLADSDDFDHVFVYTHHPMSFSQENNLGGTSGDFWQLLVGYGVTGVFNGHWHRYQPSQPGGGGSTWETIIGTGGGWTGFDPIRDYQQMWGFLVVEVDGGSAVASFYADEDGDGSFDDLMDSYTLAWPLSDGQSTQPHGLIARYTFDDGTGADSAPEHLGRGLDATLENGAQISSNGASGEALWFSDGDDYAEAGAIDDYVLSINGDLTVSMWANFASLSTSEWGNTLLCYGTNDYYTEDEETNYSYWLSIEESFGDFYLFMFWEQGDGSNVYAYSDVPVELDLDEWYHLAATRNAQTMAVEFFVNGEPLGGSVSVEAMPTGGGRGMLYFGSDTPAYVNYDYDLDGGLDEVCIYDIVLASEEIEGLSNLEDCSSYGDQPIPEDTEDTEDTKDTKDTEDTEDTGDSNTDDSDTGDTDDGSDNADVGDTVQVEGAGCSCATASLPTQHSTIWWLLGLAGFLRWRRGTAGR